MRYAGLLLILCIAVASCDNSKSKSEEKQADIPALSKQDTVDVVRLATEYLEHLKNKEFDIALQMLRCMRNDSVFELSEAERNDLKMQYQMFPVLSYKIDGIILKDVHSTEVIYSVEFFKKGPGQEEIPNTMSFRLSPQKIDDIWHLGVLNR